MATSVIRGDEVGVKICEALGIDAKKVRRVVLDTGLPGEILTAHIEMYGDERFLNIKWELGGSVVKFSGIEEV
jgi:hypothetical protein